MSFADLNKPGASQTVQRVYLQTCPPVIKKAQEDGTEIDVEDTADYEKVFENARTYVHIKFAISHPVVP